MMTNRWVVLGALFVARSALGFHFQSVASVAPLLVEDLGIDFTAIGTLIGLFSLLGVLTALPAGIGGLTRLTRLWLGSNQLEEIVDSLGHVTTLTDLRAFNNPGLKFPPPAVVARGTAASF